MNTEWPVYFERGHHQRKKVNGNINILQLGSDATDYTLIIELYNFKNNEQNLKSIGSKLRALFSLDVDCFTGINQQSDYSLLKKQYPQFNLPDTESIINKMDDVALMAINRGVAKRGKDSTTLQALCRGQNMYLKKPSHIRVGTTFASVKGQLNDEALKYCQMDVEAPLVLHRIYSGLPDLTKRLTKTRIQVGDTVDIMPESAKATDAIAQGIVTQIGGKWSPSFKLRSNQVLVEIKKVFNKRGVIHYPGDNTNLTKCSCGRKTHGSIGQSCNFYMYGQLGAPPYQVVELKSRLRAYDEDIKYPSCVFESNNMQDEITQTFAQHTVREPNASEEAPDEDSVFDSEDEQSIEEGDEGDTEDSMNYPIPPEILDELYGDDSDDEYEEEMMHESELGRDLTPQQKALAMDDEFTKTLEKIIQDADALAQSESTKAATNNIEEDLPLEELHRHSKGKKVLGDAFHFMDRAKVPMHHDFKALYFRALRAAMFIMEESDVEDVKAVLESKGDSWEKRLAFDFDYIAKRVRRRVPPPLVLYHRLKAVYDFFKDRVDSKKNQKLFNQRSRNKFENMLELVKMGYASDPDHISLYAPKTDSFGRPMVDRDGLKLYRSIRGTSNLESLHQYLTTSFGHTMAGPWYSDSLLVVVRHNLNWRMSRKNRPGFPQLSHYNGMLIDRINQLYEIIYGHVKYREWESFNENLPMHAAYGVVAVEEELTSKLVTSEADKTEIKKNKMLSYLAVRQNADVPFLPIRGESEKKLAHQKLREAIAKNQSLDSMSVFEQICNSWNAHHVSVSDKIYPKLPIHYAKYIKYFKRNQDIRDAAIYSGSNRLSQALERVPPSHIDSTFQPVSFTNSTASEISPTESVPTQTEPVTESLVLEPVVEPPTPTPTAPDALTMMAAAASTQRCIEIPTEQFPKIPKRRRCAVEGCPSPYECEGSQWKDNCLSKTGGDSTKKKKRKITRKYTKKCAVCRVQGCPGVNNRSECKNTNVNT